MALLVSRGPLDLDAVSSSASSSAEVGSNDHLVAAGANTAAHGAGSVRHSDRSCPGNHQGVFPGELTCRGGWQ